jgi:hypothetical protein
MISCTTKITVKQTKPTDMTMAKSLIAASPVLLELR